MIPQYLIDFELNDLPVVETDVIVIGSGIAGLYTAIMASATQNVLLITKKSLLESNTRYAQGGIAAVTAEDDSPAYHRQDTLLAGAGLCSSAAVDVLVNEGPVGVQELIRLGTMFDVENGELALTQEGAHSHRRILHANGDATGYEIVRALSIQVEMLHNIEVWDDHFVIDLVTEQEYVMAPWYKCRMENGYSFVDGRRLCVPAAPVNCTGIQPIRRLPQPMALPWLIGQAQKFGIWNLYNFTRRRLAIRGTPIPNIRGGSG